MPHRAHDIPFPGVKKYYTICSNRDLSALAYRNIERDATGFPGTYFFFIF
jgi:hypothetical protein